MKPMYQAQWAWKMTFPLKKVLSFRDQGERKISLRGELFVF